MAMAGQPVMRNMRAASAMRAHVAVADDRNPINGRDHRADRLDIDRAAESLSRVRP